MASFLTPFKLAGKLKMQTDPVAALGIAKQGLAATKGAGWWQGKVDVFQRLVDAMQPAEKTPEQLAAEQGLNNPEGMALASARQRRLMEMLSGKKGFLSTLNTGM